MDVKSNFDKQKFEIEPRQKIYSPETFTMRIHWQKIYERLILEIEAWFDYDPTHTLSRKVYHNIF